jgi:hypothetical protein
MTIEEIKRVLDENLTVDVPFAGKVLGDLCRNTSYDAAARGDIETIRFGRKLRVRSVWLREKLGL